MAAKAADVHEITGFSQPIKNSSEQWQPPPRKHCIAQVTGGLAEIYTKIQSGWQNADEDYSKCINEDNFFQPNSKGGLMAGRYQVIRVLGRGNSSTILQAQDTFRPGLYEVAIKVLKPEYYRLGYQESHLIAELNKADSHNFCGIVKLLNTFTLGPFFCMTFELLRPWPLHKVFKKITDKTEKLVLIRKVALRMLQILGFLGQQNVIHADLKPENILCNSENVSDGIKVIDFGNAIHGVYEELSLYYDEFELQTLLYRAPEVLLGLPFGQEIDMWSLGCILAELYLGKPLFWAKQRKELLTQMTSLFGPLPTKVYQRAKFFTRFKESIGQPSSFMDNFSNFGTKLGCIDFKFVSFLQGMLTFDPGERMSVSEAIQHPFMAPEMAIKYVLPFKINGSEASGKYSPVDLTSSMYTHAPAGTLDPRNKHLTSLELLHHGTRDTGSTTKQKVIHVVAPFELCKSSKATETVVVKVEPKSEPDDDMGIGGAQLPDARHKAIKKPLVRSAPVVMRQDVPMVSKSSSSSEDQRPPEPVIKEDISKRSKRSRKLLEKPLIGHRIAQEESDANSHHEQGKDNLLPEKKELSDSPQLDGPQTSHQTLKEPKVPAAKSKFSLSEERALALDRNSGGSSGSPGESSQQFQYLKQQRMEAVSYRNRSLGVNMRKLRKSPAKVSERVPAGNSQKRMSRPKGKSQLTKDVQKSESSVDTNGMLICNAKKSVHPKKDVTLLAAKDQKKRVRKATAKRKSEDLLEGHQQRLSTSDTDHKTLIHFADTTPCQSQVKDTTKHEKRTSVFDFIVTPEKTVQRARSRKRSLQMTGASTVKRSKMKSVPLDTKVMKDPAMDAALSKSDKCFIEALDANSPCSDMKQSDARLSSSSKPSSESTSLKSKMSILSRLQAVGDNKTFKHSISPPPMASSSSSSQPVSVKSSSQSLKRCSLESSPLLDQATKTVIITERKGSAKSHGPSPGRRKIEPKTKPLLSSTSSSSSPLVALPFLLQPSSSSSTSHSLSSKCDAKPSLHPVKQSSPALQIKRLFSSSSRSSSSPKQQKKASLYVQSQRTDLKTTEAELQLSDEEDEILLL